MPVYCIPLLQRQVDMQPTNSDIEDAMNYYVYCLIRKGEHRPFYIGCTCDTVRRRWQHAQRSALREVSFSLVVLETLSTKAAARRLEAELILWYSKRVPLMNRHGTPSGTISLWGRILDQRTTDARLEWEANRLPDPMPAPFYDTPEISAVARAWLAATKP